MSETRLTNAEIDLDVFNAYSVEPSIYQSKFFKSGSLVNNTEMSAMLSGQGESFSTPFWKDTAGGTGDVPIEGADATVNALTSGKQMFRKQVRTKVWGSNNLVGVFSGSDPMKAGAGMVANYWAQAFDQLAIKSIIGILEDNVSNNSSDLINDISAEAGAAAYFSDNAVIDTQSLLSENGSNFTAILVHPKVKAYMRKLDLIDFVPISGQDRPLMVYMGMEVIEDRNAPLTGGDYSTILMKAGSVQMGISTQGYIPSEFNREPLDGFGIDQLVTRRTFGLTVPGFASLEGGFAGLTPTDAELILAAAWERVYNAENSPIVSLRHTLPA